MIVPVAVSCPSDAAPGGLTPVKATSKVSSASGIRSWTVATRMVCRVVPVPNTTMPSLFAVKSVSDFAVPSTVFQCTVTAVRGVPDTVTANSAIPPSSTVPDDATDTMALSGSGGSRVSEPSDPAGGSG